MNRLALFLEEREAGPLIGDQLFLALMLIGVVFLAVVLIVAAYMWWMKFQRELRHLNLRIQQASSERERQHYLRRRRSLLLSIIPFVKYKHR